MSILGNSLKMFMILELIEKITWETEISKYKRIPLELVHVLVDLRTVVKYIPYHFLHFWET